MCHFLVVCPYRKIDSKIVYVFCACNFYARSLRVDYCVVCTLYRPDTFDSDDKARIPAAVVGGGIACALSMPFDTCKTCMQGDIERKKFGTMVRMSDCCVLKKNNVQCCERVGGSKMLFNENGV